MYIIEFFLKKIFPKPKPLKKNDEKEYAKCEHIFMPIDSSKKRFACTKCGAFATLEPKKTYLNPFLEKKQNTFEKNLLKI